MNGESTLMQTQQNLEFNGQNNQIQCQGHRHLQASLGMQCNTMTRFT